MMRRAFFVAMALGFAFPAHADEAAVRNMVQDKLRGSGQIESVQKAPFGDLYEVVIRSPEGSQVYYADSGGQRDHRRPDDRRKERAQSHRGAAAHAEHRQVELPAVRRCRHHEARHGKAQDRGVFRSELPYCKRFEKDLAKLDDITVHVFLYPVIKPESVTQTKAVWCSKDRAKAWNDLMLRDIQPQAKPDCDTPVEKLVTLGRKLGANSTPDVVSAERGTLPGRAANRRSDAAPGCRVAL